MSKNKEVKSMIDMISKTVGEVFGPGVVVEYVDDSKKKTKAPKGKPVRVTSLSALFKLPKNEQESGNWLSFPNEEGFWICYNIPEKSLANSNRYKQISCRYFTQKQVLAFTDPKSRSGKQLRKVFSGSSKCWTKLDLPLDSVLKEEFATK